MEILRVEGLEKNFGDVKAVNGLSFNVERGELFAFLGQNGAGKSTTINMLIGSLEADKGQITYDGDKTFGDFKEKIGVVYQNNILDDILTVKENLKLFGRLYSDNSVSIDERYEKLADVFEFKEYEKKKFKDLSGGQKRKVEIARALFNDPEILFFDEPTTGLDPKTRKDVWRIINKVRSESGMTVFLTTHYMEETVDADRVVIIHGGKKIAEGTPFELKEKYSSDKIMIAPKDESKFEALIGDMNYRKIADRYEFLSKDTREEIELLNKFKDQIEFFEVIKGSMDDVFLNSVGDVSIEELL